MSLKQKRRKRRTKVAKISVDMRGVKSGFEALPIGSYAAAVKKVEQTLSKKGNPMLKISFEITHDGFDGRTAQYFPSLLPTALFNLHGFMLATGEYDEDILDAQLEFDDQDFIGMAVAVVMVPYKRDNGEMSTSCDTIIPVEQATGPTGEPLPSSDAGEADTPKDVEAIFGGMQAK